MLDGINAVAAVRKVGIPPGMLCWMRRSGGQIEKEAGGEEAG